MTKKSKETFIYQSLYKVRNKNRYFIQTLFIKDKKNFVIRKSDSCNMKFITY